jgi:hypothetical protein
MPKVSYASLIKTRFMEAGTKGLTVADLFKELKEGVDNYKTNATYNSFARFCYWYQQLGYIEPTGITEPSYTKGREELEEAKSVLEDRTYFRITPKGKAEEWSNPLAIRHPQWSPTGDKKKEYMREYMKEYLPAYRQRQKVRVILSQLLQPLRYSRGRPPIL